MAPPTASASGEAASDTADCRACWGLGAPTIGQGINTVINHLFNSTFDWLATLPGGPIANLLEGALVLVRRSMVLSPEGVTASQVGNELTVSVDTGSVAYFRQSGPSLQISGDPWFLGAESFDVAPDVTVSVANAGNAGCAGFVMASGQMLGNLVTSQIDSIRFAADAAVYGEVDATVTDGAVLRLSDAVRGLLGVSLSGPVSLANDVEIDAGAGDATFSGTVDAARAGQQSLTVTALGTTTFAAPVGSNEALGSLLTQGIAPLVVEQSGDSKSIPLHFLPELNPDNALADPGVKYGIDVAFGDNASQVYEFDTGGTAFFAGYNQQFWKGVQLTSTPASETYNSGNFFDGVVADAVLTLGSGSQTISSGYPISVAAILSGGNSKDGSTFVFTDPSAPPVQGQFFGDFGGSFQVRNGLTNPLLQLPGNLGTGFLVQLGPIGVTPQLTAGVTDELRAQFPYAVPVLPSSKGGTYPNSEYAVLEQFGFAPTYFVSQGSDVEILGNVPPEGFTCPQQCLPTLIDSGAPTTGLRLPGAPTPFATPDGKQLKAGTNFTAVFPAAPQRPAPLVWQFEAGNTSSVDEVKYDTSAEGQNVNVGLTLYNYFDVMFDVEQQTIWLRPTGGQSTVVLNSVTTTGAQIYRENASLAGTFSTGDGRFSIAGVTILAADTTVNAGGGDVTFSGTIDAGAGGAQSLSVNSLGVTRFVRQVGGRTPLASLATDAGGTTEAASVSTAGNQTYDDSASLIGAYSATGGSFSVAGSTTAVGPVSIVAKDISLRGDVDSAAGRGYQLSLTVDGGEAQINGDVGLTNPLGGLAVFSSGAATVTVPGYVVLIGTLGASADKGLYIGDGVTASFTGGGVIQNFTNSGVVVEKSRDSVIEDFAISGNGTDGVQINGASNPTISGNVVSGNGASGIKVEDVEGGTLENNTVLNNGGGGVTLAGGSGTRVLSNTITSNNGNGVTLSAADNVIASNTIESNTADGVRVSSGNGNQILTNSIAGNNDAGIALDPGANNDQKAPVVSAATLTTIDGGGVLVVQVDLSEISGTSTIQLFYSPAGDADTVQGAQWLVTTSETGPGTVPITVQGLPANVVVGGYVTATATVSGNTSAFSGARLISTG